MIIYCIKRRKGTRVPKKLMLLQEIITNQIGFGWLLVSILPRIIVAVVCILICYNLAVKAKVSKGFAFLGLFGVFGVIIMVVIHADKKGKMNNRNLNNQQNYGYQQNNSYQQGNGYQQSNSYQQSNGYQQSNDYQQSNSYQQGNGYQQGNSYQQSNNYQQNTTPYGETSNGDDAFRTETINSDNYQFNGGMNVCETHQHDDTYSASYDDVMDEQPKSYNLNGENVSYGKGLCPHCGAKLKKFQRFCDSCGSRV